MDLTIALEHRFSRTPDGAVWTATSLPRGHWRRYLGRFERVRILARVQDVRSSAPGWSRVDGERVEIAPVPHFVGPRAFVLRWRAVTRSVRAALAAHPTDAVILRVPGTIGSIAARALAASGRPFAVEVVGDPYDVFAPGSVDHPLRPFLRWWSPRELRRQCAAASSALYVASSLQGRYPPPRAGCSYCASDAEMPESAYVAAPRRRDAAAGPPFRIVTVGSLEQLYKGTDVLLRAIARCAEGGLDATLVIVGDGRHRGAMEHLARRVGISARVRFAGQLPSGAAVVRELDDAHLFVLPSRTEGMPRAMLEAMARGLPCLGTAVGGIPELLPGEALVRLDARSIARRIREVATSPELRERMSRQNLARARDFHERRLQPVREAFFDGVIAATAPHARPAPHPPLSAEPRGARVTTAPSVR